MKQDNSNPANSFINFFLLAILFTLLWYQLFSPKEDKQPKAVSGIKTPLANRLNAGDTLPTDSTARVKWYETRFGPFSKAAQGENRKIKVLTDKLQLVLNTQGAALQPIYLTHFRTYDSLPLPIFPPGTGNHCFIEFGIPGRGIFTRDLYFSPSIDEQEIKVTGKEQKSIRLRAAINETQYLEYIYTFRGNTYDVGLQVQMVGMGNLITESSYYLTKEIVVPQTEKSIDKMRPEVTLCYKDKADDDVEHMKISDEDTLQSINIPVDWVAFKSQFFSNVVICDKIKQAKLISTPLSSEQSGVRRLAARMTIAYSRNALDSTNFNFYFGPNKLSVLSTYDKKLDRIVQLGWGPIRYVTLLINGVFQTLENITSNYGIIIFLLAIFIKLLLLPLTFKSYLSSARMQIVNRMPEIKAIEERFKDNPAELQQRKMHFYQQSGVNIFGGCIPLLLQLPIFFAMFTFFPQSIELRQQGFLWANDLSTYDSILDFGKIPIVYQIYGDHISLFALLMTISNVAYAYIQQRIQGTSINPQMQIIAYVMPVVFLSILNNYSAGLSYYYFILNVLTIIQTFGMQYFVSEEKIREKIKSHQEQNKKSGGKKKSRFQSWIEEQQKKQEAMMRERKK